MFNHLQFLKILIRVSVMSVLTLDVTYTNLALLVVLN